MTATHRGTTCLAAGRLKSDGHWRGDQGDELTLVAACRDVLRLVSAEEGTSFEDELKPVIDDAEDRSQRLEEVWTDDYQPYQPPKRDPKTVVHDEGYVSNSGVHPNQVECLWSLLNPWIEKCRGISNQCLEQAAHTYGFLQSFESR